MRARWKTLCDHSVGMMLAAIEVYNKPTFPQREQVFTVLVVNAWEGLLKAKLLKDGGNQLRVLYVKDGNRYKRTKAGRYLTIDIRASMRKCNLPDVVVANLDHLIETRNAATHLTAQSKFLPLLVFTLGTAALRNYSELIRRWFGLGLSRYNFFILPIGFSYPFESLSLIDLRKEPDDISSILKAVSIDQGRPPANDGLFLVCELKTSLVSSKKITATPDLTASVDPSEPSAAIISPMKLTDRYPYSFTEACKKIRESVPGFTTNQLTRVIKEHEVKGNDRYSAYSYANKRLENKGPTNSTPVIYNDDFIQFCIHLSLNATGS